MQAPQTAPSSPAYRLTKPQRILSCALCKQRKVKCDRKVPCNHCIKGKKRCVPAHQMRGRRKRSSEQDVTEKLQQYEELLRKNNIAMDNTGVMDTYYMTADAEAILETSRDQRETIDVVKNTRDTNHQSMLDSQGTIEEANSDDSSSHPGLTSLSGPVIDKESVRAYESDHSHLFGVGKINAPLSTLHPGQARLFKLWQVYSENINPLVKVTHAPTLQASIVDALADLNSISCGLEALMFSIYCAALMTISEDECCAALGEPKAQLLGRYRDACRQALIRCGFLRSRERDCLTAYFLYLISLQPDTHPHTLSPMFGIAFRIAYRMNICNEAANVEHGVFEAEMRRRLWWAMVAYDSRLSEMTDHKTTQLIPTWDCAIPANLDDFDLRPEMTAKPVGKDASTEASFIVVRGMIGNFIRHNPLHLNLIDPTLRHIAKATQYRFRSDNDDLDQLKHIVEDRILRHCVPENPLHYMTIWWTRNYLARYCFFLYSSQHPVAVDNQPTEQRDNILSGALRMLECDTALTAPPLVKIYRWIIQLHFPFQAYMRIVQDLRSRPVGPHADKAWEAMSANYAVRLVDMKSSANIPFKRFASTALQAWAARRAALPGQNHAKEAETMIMDIEKELNKLSSASSIAESTIAPVQTDMAMLVANDVQGADSSEQG